MRITVLFFASARERAGATTTDVELDEGATVESLFGRLVADVPALADILPGCRAAVDEEFARASTVLENGQTVAILPPVSGG
jgi:molybdopterin synthase catalytic subunit